MDVDEADRPVLTIDHEQSGDPILVEQAELLSLDTQREQLQIDFYGDPDHLAVALAQRDVVLEQRDGFWQMRARQP